MSITKLEAVRRRSERSTARADADRKAYHDQIRVEYEGTEKSLQTLADETGLSRPRIHQIVNHK